MNVLNVGDIERELTKLAARARHPEVKRWVLSVARNHILGKLTEKDIIVNFRPYAPNKHTDPLMPQLKSIPAWAKSALERGEELRWFIPHQLKRRMLWQMLDAIVAWFNTFKPTDTRLRRIDRINFDTAVKAASMWFKDLNENFWLYVKDKPPIVKTYEHGFHWVRLVTNLHFEREGKIMAHCLYSHNYFDRWKAGTDEFFSLRSKDNEPHCTVQVHFEGRRDLKGGVGKVAQCKGKANQRPADKYQPYIRRFFEDMGWKLEGDAANY